jgi:hypothetical protein
MGMMVLTPYPVRRRGLHSGFAGATFQSEDMAGAGIPAFRAIAHLDLRLRHSTRIPENTFLDKAIGFQVTGFSLHCLLFTATGLSYPIFWMLTMPWGGIDIGFGLQKAGFGRSSRCLCEEFLVGFRNAGFQYFEGFGPLFEGDLAGVLRAHESVFGGGLERRQDCDDSKD